MSFLSRDELRQLGLMSFGERVSISRKASIYRPDKIRLGNDIRIDDFCILAAGDGGIDIGSHVHISAHAFLVGSEPITLCDFSGISARVCIYSSSDDYSGEWMTNPTVPKDYTNVRSAPVFIGRHAIVGSGSIILPGARLEEGVAVGALSLVTGHCPAFGIYAGTPARRIKERSRQLLELEGRFHERHH